MIKYESNIEGEAHIKASGSLNDIAYEATIMIALIYKGMFKKNPIGAAIFRSVIMSEINYLMNEIERDDI